MHLIKTPRTTYTYSVDVAGQPFQPCDLLDTLWSVRNQQVDISRMPGKQIAALLADGAIASAGKDEPATGGPRIDEIVAELIAMIEGDDDLMRIWQNRHAMAYHPGALRQRT